MKFYNLCWKYIQLRVNKYLEQLLACVNTYRDSVYENESESVQELARRAMFLALAIYDQARRKEVS